jgi:hypothetical protein
LEDTWLPVLILTSGVGLVGVIALTVKAIVEGRTRQKFFASAASDERMRSLLRYEARLRRHAALRWGLVMSGLAGGFAVIDAIGWQDVTPGAIAVLLAATGIGNLASYAIERAQARKGDSDD